MMELFVVSALAQKMSNTKAKEDQRLSEFSDIDIIEHGPNIRWVNIMSGLLALLVSILAGRLAFLCNSKSDPIIQAISTIFAFFFSGFYLVYYLLVRIVMGYKC